MLFKTRGILPPPPEDTESGELPLMSDMVSDICEVSPILRNSEFWVNGALGTPARLYRPSYGPFCITRVPCTPRAPRT